MLSARIRHYPLRGARQTWFGHRSSRTPDSLSGSRPDLFGRTLQYPVAWSLTAWQRSSEGPGPVAVFPVAAVYY